MVNNDTKLEPGEAKNVRTALSDEMAKVKATKLEPLASINSIAFGLSSPGQGLWTQVDKAGQHVNDTLENLHKALRHYHDAFKHAAHKMYETQNQVTADAKLLAEGVNLIQKPFYANKKSPQPLLPPYRDPRIREV